MSKIWPLLFFLISCSNPLEGRGKLHFKDMTQDALEQSLKAEKAKKQLKEDIEKDWYAIISEATSSFEEIRPIIERKCFDCHDANTKLPFYARTLPGINPLKKHQDHGLIALDFSGTFPLKSKGTASQLALLTSIRNAVVDRSMPLKSYVTVYRNRKITVSDEEKILAWIDPLIERIEDHEERYQDANKPEAVGLLEQKCFRCHANGVAKGGLGDMQDTAKLFKSKYINLNDPTDSIIFTISSKDQMPPKKSEALTQDELIILRDWIELEATKTIGM